MTRRLKPGWTESLLRSLAPDFDVEAMLGDLAEERAVRHRRIPRSSCGAWYYSQLIRSLPDLWWSSVTGRGWPVIWGTALLLYIAALVAQLALSVTLSKVLEPGYLLEGISLILGAGTFVIAGYAAAWVRPRATPALAATVTLVIIVLIVTAADGTSPWYEFALILGPTSVLIGGARFMRTRR